MSTPSDFELDLDLQLLPAWAREPAAANRYAKFEGEAESERRGRPGRPFERRERWGERPPRRERQPGERAGRPDATRSHPGGPRPGGPPEPGRDERRGKPSEPPVPLPEVNVDFVPEEKGVDALARQIKLRGRAYPLFEIAALILKAPERYQVRFSVCRGPDGTPVQPLVVCSLDESLWLTSDEVVDHVLRHHLATFYQTEKVPTEPPKGTYTFVAQCGMSGVILGPPNYHDYQTKLRKLHAERFARMPFDVFKSRVKIVKDESVVKRWIDEQSWRLEYVCLNVPESVKFATREEVEQHFRTVHLPNLSRSVETFLPPASAGRPFLSPALGQLSRHALEDQRRFPLKLAMTLSQQFAARGLQFFKVNRTVTHVCVARPHHLDLQSIVVSEGVRRIVEFIDQHSGCNRRSLIGALAPPPASPPAPLMEPPPASGGDVPPKGTPAPASEAPPPRTPAEVDASQPTPEQTVVITDLHWLIHQGHVIEFSDGRLETAKPPRPRPPTAPKAEAPPSAESAPEQPPVESAAVAELPPVPSGAVPPPDTTDEPPASTTLAGPSPEPVPEPAAGTTPTPPPPAAPAEAGPGPVTSHGVEGVV